MDELRDQRRVKRAQHRFHGWRVGTSLCAAVATTIMTFNILVTAIASGKGRHDNGLALIQEGSCSKTKNIRVWLHLLINVLSTVLLAASNYCMQCLSSPTRDDIDKAHAKRGWLDIGVPSLRNLQSIPPFRVVLWGLLASSSVPLHLLYNSAVISTQASQEYVAFVASPDLLSGQGVNWSQPIGTFVSYEHENSASDGPPDLGLVQQYRDVSSWQNLSNEECIKAYAQNYVQGHGDLLAITTELNATEPMKLVAESLSFDTSNSQWVWMCGEEPRDCTTSELLGFPSDWSLNDTTYDSTGLMIYYREYPIEYCISEPMEDHCTLQLSLVIMTIVIICNAIKACCMLLMLWHQKSAPLVTTGDSIESFMTDRDATTADMCWANVKTFAKQKDWQGAAKPWLRQRHFRFAAASMKRWLICHTLSITTITATAILLSLEHRELENPNELDLWVSGFGELQTQLMANWRLPGATGLVGLALLVNVPQLLLSFLYLTYNALFTCMLLAAEWNDYAHERKPLRVTQATGSQRSTYRLQLPYKYSIPLMIISAFLHWLVSQSLFLARVTLYSRTGGADSERSISTLGYSFMPMLTAITIGAMTVLIGILHGFRLYKPGIPLVGSCSAAISAACHVPSEDDMSAAEQPVKWGVVGGRNEDGVGHCTFTSLDVTSPLEFLQYAGY